MINVDIVRRLKLSGSRYLSVALRPVAAALITVGITLALNAAGVNSGLRGITAFLMTTPLLAVWVVGRGLLITVIAPAMPGLRRMFIKEHLEALPLNSHDAANGC